MLSEFIVAGESSGSKMNWSDLLAAFALYLVIEGMLPFVSPESWRKTLMFISSMNDGQLRFFGLASIIFGLGILLLVRSGT